LGPGQEGFVAPDLARVLGSFIVVPKLDVVGSSVLSTQKGAERWAANPWSERASTERSSRLRGADVQAVGPREPKRPADRDRPATARACRLNRKAIRDKTNAPP